MVKPFWHCLFSRCFVRIPRSENNHYSGDIESSQLDLRRVSTMATVLTPALQPLPAALLNKRSTVNNYTNTNLKINEPRVTFCSSDTELSSRDKPRYVKALKILSSSGSAVKIARTMYISQSALERASVIRMSQEEIARCKNIITVNTPIGPIRCLVVNNNNCSTIPNLSPTTAATAAVATEKNKKRKYPF
nr:MAG: hypothetical protein [Metapenaeopsis lamellata majanivirus]